MTVEVVASALSFDGVHCIDVMLPEACEIRGGNAARRLLAVQTMVANRNSSKLRQDYFSKVLPLSTYLYCCSHRYVSETPHLAVVGRFLRTNTVCAEATVSAVVKRVSYSSVLQKYVVLHRT